MNFRKDLQASSAKEEGEIIIDKVGIINVKRRIEIQWDSIHRYWVSPTISALIRLPKTQRGIHMSRSAETVEEAINMTLFRPVHSLEEFAKRILDKLLEMHEYTDHAEVDIKGDLILQAGNGDREYRGQKPYEIMVHAEVNRNIYHLKKDKSSSINDGYDYYGYVAISAWGMTCCPCAQEMNIEYIEDVVSNRPELGISKSQLKQLLNIIPVASHNQRAKATIQLSFSHLDHEVINLLDLIDVIESSMSAKISPILKRPHEAEVVRIAHLNPKFAEDVIRTMAQKMATSKFYHLEDGCKIKCSIISYESIHVHDVYAELNTTIGNLRKLFA